MDNMEEIQPSPDNIKLEIALTKMARIIYEYAMSQNDTEQLHLVDALVDAHREVTNDYCHSHPERLFGGDLALNISIWIGFKQDAIKSSSNKDKQLAEGYRQEVVDMIEELENILGIS